MWIKENKTKYVYMGLGWGNDSVFHALLTAGTQIPWFFSFEFQCGQGMPALLIWTHKRKLLAPSICGPDASPCRMDH